MGKSKTKAVRMSDRERRATERAARDAGFPSWSDWARSVLCHAAGTTPDDHRPGPTPRKLPFVVMDEGRKFVVWLDGSKLRSPSGKVRKYKTRETAERAGWRAVEQKESGTV